MVVIFMQTFKKRITTAKGYSNKANIDMQTWILPQYSFYSDGRISVFLLENYSSSIFLHVIWIHREVKIVTQDWNLCSLGVTVTNDRKHRGLPFWRSEVKHGSLGANLMVSAGRLFPFRGPRKRICSLSLSDCTACWPFLACGYFILISDSVVMLPDLWPFCIPPIRMLVIPLGHADHPG